MVSEYQYYEFLAVDRPLDATEVDELRALSTRAEITPTSFVSTYHWRDFRGDPHALMQKYFDAGLYFANRGTRRLILRLPASLLDLTTAQRYCGGQTASAWAHGEHVIIDLVRQVEDDDFEYGGEGWLTSIIAVRADLAAGDRRALYLAWLLAVQHGELAADDVEPPVPRALRTLTASLRTLVDFLNIDEDLLAVAASAGAGASAEVSGPQPGESPVADLYGLVQTLPVTDKNAMLVAIARGDVAQVRAELLRRLHGGPAGGDAGGRTAGALLDAADARRQDRERFARERRAGERARLQREAAHLRDEYLDSVARQSEQVWQRVSALIDTKKSTHYDAAVELLKDLCAVSVRAGRPEEFERRFQRLRRQHSRKANLLERFDRAGLGAGSVPVTR